MSSPKRYTFSFDMATPMVEPSHPLLADSLLGAAACRNVGLITGPPEAFDKVNGNLPLRKVFYGKGPRDYFYAASQAVYTEACGRFKYCFSKANTYNRYSSVISNADDLRKFYGKLDKGNTEMKTGWEFLPLVSVRQVSLVVDTNDPDAVLRLFQGITHIGKKSAWGMGRVRDGGLTMDETPDAVIVRPVPVAAGFDVEGPVFMQRMRPAYFLPTDRIVAGTGVVSANV
jgi:CRISPR type IV-associated protein Csf3